jgi:PDZ domain-containing protein
VNARGESGDIEAGSDAAGTLGTRPPVEPDATDQLPSAPQRRSGGLTRRTWTLMISFVLLVALGLIGGFVQVPYVALGPGPTFDTLSSDNGTAIVSINGHQTYQTSGQLRMVTVSLNDGITLFGALGLWLSGRYQLAPRDEYFPPGQSEQQTDQQNVQEFQESQSNAEVAALRYLKYPIEVLAQSVSDNSPADHKIKPGDRIISVDGKAATSVEDVTGALAGTKPGQVVPVVVQTGNQPQRTLQITLAKRTDGLPQGFVGVGPGAEAMVPFKVNISLDNIGGPSAGLMFALAIVDKLTPSGVNGGMAVAGTGEIDDLGNVSEIGGIPFKLVAAREAGAQIFLTPAANCAEAEAHVPAGLRLVKVTTLTSAIQDLADLKAGRPVPSC